MGINDKLLQRLDWKELDEYYDWDTPTTTKKKHFPDLHLNSNQIELDVNSGDNIILMFKVRVRSLTTNEKKGKPKQEYTLELKEGSVVK